jgi:hypothetical protein
MNTISYFQDIPNIKSGSAYSVISRESKKLVDLYKKTWSKYGWDPIVLDEEYAQKNKLYKDLSFNNPKANFYKNKLDPHHSFGYMRACYLRLLAYCEYVRRNGVTLYSDYDVMNYGLHPSVIDEIEPNSSLCDQRSVIYLDLKGAEEMEDALRGYSTNDSVHYEHDMQLMKNQTKLFKNLVDKNGEYIYCYPYLACTKRDASSPLIHYNGACYSRGISKNLSRSEVIINHGRI